MRETRGDLFQTIGIYDAMCITTNGTIKRDGTAVMGAGCAKVAKAKWPGIDSTLGKMLRAHGNHCIDLWIEVQGQLVQHVYSFPVKRNWWEKASPSLIRRSCQEMMEIANREGYHSIVIPRPGCGNGKRKWDEIKPILEEELDDRFYIITY